MRYLLLPKVDDLGDAFAAESGSLRPAARAQRLELLAQARRSAEAARLRRGGAESVQAFRGEVTVLASPVRETPITGVTVLEADADNRAALRAIDETFPDHERVEDFALDLIAPPERDAASGDDSRGSAADASAEELWHLDRIGLLAARRLGFDLRGEGATVAVLDTGVAEVPELEGRIVENRTFDPETWAYAEAPIVDTDGHGTHVAGIIAGRSVGVAPGARIVSMTMIPHQIGSLSHYVFALEHAQTRPEIRILNVSAGKGGRHPQMRNMAKIAERLEVLTVVAIGNEGQDTSRSPGNYPEVISVGAMDAQGAVWSGSGGGTVMWDGAGHTTPSLVAPGVAVLSCVSDGRFRPETGTSMATPIVAGIAALIIGRFPDITVRQLRDEILTACISLNLDVGRQGAGAARLPPSLLAGLALQGEASGAPEGQRRGNGTT